MSRISTQRIKTDDSNTIAIQSLKKRFNKSKNSITRVEATPKLDTIQKQFYQIDQSSSKKPQSVTDSVSIEKYQKLKDLNKELKHTLRKFVETSDNQDPVDQLKERCYQLELKLHKKDGKLNNLKHIKRISDAEFQDKSILIEKEIETLQRLCDELNDELNLIKEQNNGLKNENLVLREKASIIKDELISNNIKSQDIILIESELNKKLQIEREENYLLQNKLKSYERKANEDDLLIQRWEEKYQNLKRKKQEQIAAVQLESQQSTLQKKDKIKKLKLINDELNQQLAIINEQERFSSQLIESQKSEINLLNQTNANLLSELNEFKQKFKFQEAQFEKQKEDTKRLSLQCDILQKKLDESGKDYYDLKVNNEDLRKSINQKQIENQELLLANNNIKEQILKEQAQSEKVSCEKSIFFKEVTLIENKVDSMLLEINKQNQEIAKLKTEIKDKKNKIQQQEELIQTLQSKVKKHKTRVKMQDTQLINLEQKIKKYEYEMILESREQFRKTQQDTQSSQKLKVQTLEDIQGIIRQHKFKFNKE